MPKILFIKIIGLHANNPEGIIQRWFFLEF